MTIQMIFHKPKQWRGQAPCHYSIRSVTVRIHQIGLLIFLLLLSSTAHARIVFSSTRGGVKGIYVMNDDGTNETLLTESEELRPHPNSWSPDGKMILYQSRVNWKSNSVLFLMNPDGTNVRQLTENDGSTITYASFSPDGKSIVFDRDIVKNNKLKFSITVMNIKTGKMKIIADMPATACDWSPDGQHIIFSQGMFVGGRGGTIWKIGSDGQNPRQLIPNPDVGRVLIHRTSPEWSPDGKKIVYIHREYTWDPIPGVGTALIYHAHYYMVCDANGGNISKLGIPKDWEGLDIDWMDDGESVVLSAYVGLPLGELPPPFEEFPPCNIYKYHIETGEITRLTNHPGRDETLDWISDDVLSVTPDGKKKTRWGNEKK